MTKRPHDALFKAAFESPEHAAALFRHLLPASVSSAIAWDSIALQMGSFVDPELADRHSDLLFSVALRSGGEAFLYLLLEHQSENAADMPMRVLVYEVRIWERFQKEHGAAPLPPIIPVVISHVEGGWRSPRAFEELFDASLTSIPGLAELVPKFSLVIEDLAHRSNEDIKSLAAFAKLALWALRDGRNAERFLQSCDEWFAAFVEARRAPRGIQALTQLMRYLALVMDPLPFDVFRARIREELPATEENTMSWFEHQQEKARAEGRAKERVDMLHKLLVLKFGAIDAEHAARIETATPESLERFLERVLTATTLAAVLAD